MNSWPTLKVWGELVAVLLLELLVLCALAKLVAARLRSASWQRALWQMTLLASLLVTAGELSGVRHWLHLLPPAPAAAPPPKRAVVVTIKDPAASPTPKATVLTMPPPADGKSPPWSAWQQRASWPATVWLAGTALLLLRLVAAQFLTLAFRSAARRCADGELNQQARHIAGLLRISRPVRLAWSFQAVAPFTFGVWRPVIVLPFHFKERFNAPQRDVALTHELAHVAAFDSGWRTLSHFFCALLWWNPFAWLLKRVLDDASELAADEASLLLADGPGHLAECLLLCARAPSRPALASWLGMDGGGFRSVLGRRIAHLMQLKSRDRLGRRVPWYGRVLFPLLAVALLWSALAVLHPPPAGSAANAWRGSILGSAFAAAPTPLENSLDANRVETARLVQDGKLYYETGRLLEARTNLLEALRREPTNQAAFYYLDLLDARIALAAERRVAPKESPERQQLIEKLRRLRLPQWGPFHDVPLNDVVRALADEIRRLEPDQRGVNFIISPNAGDPKFNWQIGEQPIDWKAVTVRLENALRDITVEEALNVLTRTAASKLNYSVEDYGVVISPPTPEREPLHTRYFKLDPVSFQRALQSVTAFDFNTGKTNRVRAQPSASTNILFTVRAFFQTAGIDLTEGGKALFYNDRLGVLMVRATLQDLDTVEKALQLVNPPQSQILLRVKAIEVPANAAALFQYALTNAPVPALNTSEPHKLTNSTLSLQGILSDEQSRAIIAAMEQSGGTDLLSAPDVTTHSGRQAQLKAVDIRYIVTGYMKSRDTADIAVKKQFYEEQRRRVETGSIPALEEKLAQRELELAIARAKPSPVTEPFELGPIVDVIPDALPDGDTIRLHVVPKLLEFLGYDDPGAFVAGDSKELQQPAPRPKFRLRQAPAEAVLSDGQTLVLGAGTARHAVRTRRMGAVATTSTEKALFFFITPRLIDPAGNPIHSDDELKRLHGRAPAPEQSVINSGARKNTAP